MNKTDLKTLITDKVAEITTRISYVESDECTLSECTRKTQSYQLRRQRKTLHLIDELVQKGLEGISSESHDLLITLTTLEGERNRSIVTVQEGDSILELMQRYQDVNKLAEKLTRAAEKIGCKLDYISGKVVKA